jgi:Predicted phosphatases
VVTKNIGQPLEEMIFKILITDYNDYIKQGVTYFREHYRDKGLRKLKFYSGVSDTLKKLKSGGKKLYIVTSNLEVFVRQICEECGVLDCFTDISGVYTDKIILSKGKRMQILME